MRVHHQTSSQPYIPPLSPASFPVKSHPDVIDTLATSSMNEAPAKTTQDRQDNNNNNNSEISNPIRSITCWLKWAHIFYVRVYKCVYHYHYQTYGIVPPLLAVFWLKALSLISTAPSIPPMKRAPVVTTQVI